MIDTVIDVNLKPCPFCDGEAELIVSGNGEFAIVSCKNCEVDTPMYAYVENAIEAWNRRGTRWIRAKDKPPEDPEELVL